MSRKLYFCTSFIFVLVLFLTSARAELIGWWTFDEGSGDTVYDLSGKSNDGHFGPEGDPQWVEGIIGGAIELDGNDDYIEINSLADDLTDNNFTVSAWIKTTAGEGNVIGANDTGSGHQFIFGVTGSGTLLVEAGSTVRSYPPVINDGEWHFIAYVRDGTTAYAYTDGELVGTEVPDEDPSSQVRWSIGMEWDSDPSDEFTGLIDDVHFFDNPLTSFEIQHLMQFPYASRPEPADGTILYDTWTNLGWRPGDFAVSHDIYLGENFDDVNEGTGDTFQGNQTGAFYTIGFPGFAYPDGLIPGTTYYWRIDEVNEADPNSPWRGKVWSFTIPPKTAFSPNPIDGDEFIDLNVQLSWTSGFGAKLHYIVFGEDFDEVNNAATGVPNGSTSYSPGQLELAKTYYWRVDEFDGSAMLKGEVWSFTTEGAVSGPNPANGDTDVSPTQILKWDAGAVAASHEVYFGSDANSVKNATKSSLEYKGPKALGEESYDPGVLSLNSEYFWRIDEVNNSNPDSPWIGNVWSFTTGDFFVIDDFESYDSEDNQIWFAWHDGLGYGAPGTPDFFAGNGTGAAVGDETTTSYTEEAIVHGGLQSMPVAYDNNKQGLAKYSEVEFILTDIRDWTAEGVVELSIWFRGYPASVGSFIEGPVGTYTITATGADIWNMADEFHYAFKTLTGAGSIVARVESVELTDPWAKAGVMIRETLDAGSKFAAVYITPTNADGSATNGCRFQARSDTDVSATSDTSVATAEQTAITAPYWIKLERDVAGNFRGSYSADGSTWRQMSWNPQNIAMSSSVYVGLALTSHNNTATCEAKFSNVTITGTVNGQWASQDIGIESNDAEPLYIALSNSTGTPVIVVHDDPTAAQIDTWTEWIIPLQAFADQGIDLTNVDKIVVGLGNKGNMTTPGGSGKMFIDDIRLYQPREAAE